MRQIRMSAVEFLGALCALVAVVAGAAAVILASARGLGVEPSTVEPGGHRLQPGWLGVLAGAAVCLSVLLRLLYAKSRAGRGRRPPT